MVGRIVSMKNSNDTIGNRTRDLPACRIVPPPSAPPRDPKEKRKILKIFKEEALACTLWTIRCGRGYGLGARQTTKCVLKIFFIMSLSKMARLFPSQYP